MVNINYIPPERAVENAIRDQARQVRDAQRSTGTERNLVTQNLSRSMLRLEEAFTKLDAQQVAMIDLFNRLPQNGGAQINTTGWAVDTAPGGTDWTTIASASVTRPANMNRVVIHALGSAAGQTSGDFVYAMHARLVVNGLASPEVEGSLEEFASTSRSALQVAFLRELSSFSADVSVQLQARGRFSGYPNSNNAALTVSAAFSRVG